VVTLSIIGEGKGGSQMRKLIMTKDKRFDILYVHDDIEAIIAAFSEYLDGYPAKTERTMHGLMGPVPKILDGARIGKEDLKTLAGRAVRAHEMTRDSKYVSPGTIQALERGIGLLLALCEKTPESSLTKVIEQIRFGLYYVRRKKSIDRMEQVRQYFIKYLKEHYADDKSLADAWKEPNIDFETVYYPSKKQGEKATGKKKEDMEAFWALPAAERFPQVEEEDEE
jgi:hypothetical protein